MKQEIFEKYKRLGDQLPLGKGGMSRTHKKNGY